ncbi:hypothetical protein CCR75_005204 [Bremia lactucae]|uniref:TFIIS N-terminal domain-containing protein n=1 Tax=Bremia lactucae TaxID=4779 RepID=A0A976IMC4_BRELC|nr:hypothetical protein CCR75_005204 [Bremia lactucae]
MVDEVVPNSVGWYILEGYPWWPVYICDVFKLRPTLHLLGSGHKTILKKARDFPKDFIVVYYFGSHDFSLVGLKNGVLRPWECAQKEQFLKGHPKHLTKKKGTMDELLVAIQEAEDYLSQPEDMRLPQHMVPSDLDPTLEPPPPELMSVDMATDYEVDDDEHMDDDERTLFNEKEIERKLKKKKKEKVKKDDKKRNNDGSTKKTSPKVFKTVDTDVKSQILDRKKSSRRPPTNLSPVELSIILEKEIRWILVNCPFEEMTTKTVRKLLEDRLHLDLRHHKASIKEGVARVIASMEEEDGAESTILEEPRETKTNKGLNVDNPVHVKEEAGLENLNPVVKTEGMGVKEEAMELEKTRMELEAVSKNLSLALELEPKILDALESLRSLESVNRNVLAASTLRSRLVKLRAHKSFKIANLVTLLVKMWKVEDLIPAPKSITKEEILKVKAKLERELSHDDLLGCLDQLAEMPLTIDHLKKTGIARAVSKLRQHGNDKVSSKAHELRQKWIEQRSDQSVDNDSASNPLETLKTLIRLLDQSNDDVSDHQVQSKQLAALEQLHSMVLDTKDIIDSKVGISVSKLRKSSDEKVAKLAKKIRKKWQAEAKAKSGAPIIRDRCGSLLLETEEGQLHN